MTNRTFYVYLIYRSSEPMWRYVGKGSNDRVFNSLKERKGDSYKIVFRTNNEPEAFRMENCVYINLLKRGYILANRGRPNRRERTTSGWKQSSEAIERIRQGNIQAALAGKFKHSYIPSEETKRKISLACRGKKQSSEHVAKRVQSRRGYKHSEEAKGKLRSRVVSQETREKMRQAALASYAKRREQT